VTSVDRERIVRRGFDAVIAPVAIRVPVIRIGVAGAIERTRRYHIDDGVEVGVGDGYEGGTVSGHRRTTQRAWFDASSASSPSERLSLSVSASARAS
jgi:hypothetical protein